MPKSSFTRQAFKSKSSVARPVLSKSAAAARRPPSIVSVLAEAEQLLIQSDATAALQLLSPLLVHSSQNAKLQDLLAQAYMDLDRPAQAYSALCASCSLEPSSNGSKWMYRAQFETGNEALKSFQQGVEIFTTSKNALQAQLETDSKSEDNEQKSPATSIQLQISQLQQAISSAYVSMAELFTTDLCDEPIAETECERLLQSAVNEWSDNIDAWYAFANFRAIQQNGDEAEKCLRKSLDLINKNTRFSELPAVQLAIEDEDEDNMTSKSLELDTITYEVRVNIAKLALELGMYQEALDLLEDLLEEDDRFTEVWHLAAVSAVHVNRWKRAKEYAAHARLMLGEARLDEEDGVIAMRRALIVLQKEIETKLREDPNLDVEEEDDEDIGMEEEEDEKSTEMNE